MSPTAPPVLISTTVCPQAGEGGADLAAGGQQVLGKGNKCCPSCHAILGARTITCKQCSHAFDSAATAAAAAASDVAAVSAAVPRKPSQRPLSALVIPNRFADKYSTVMVAGKRYGAGDRVDAYDRREKVSSLSALNSLLALN